MSGYVRDAYNCSPTQLIIPTSTRYGPDVSVFISLLRTAPNGISVFLCDPTRFVLDRQCLVLTGDVSAMSSSIRSMIFSGSSFSSMIAFPSSSRTFTLLPGSIPSCFRASCGRTSRPFESTVGIFIYCAKTHTCFAWCGTNPILVWDPDVSLAIAHR